MTSIEINSEFVVSELTTLCADDKLYDKGVSAMYGGYVCGDVIIAGGCNFPNIPLLEGGSKVYYDNIYRGDFQSSGDIVWLRIGRLPMAAAYGVSIAKEDGLFIIGGKNDYTSFDNVFFLSFVGDSLVGIERYPNLPVKVDNMAGTISGNKLYIVGGYVDGTPSNKLFSLDLGDVGVGWVEEVPFPGSARVQPICASVGDKLYMFGGFCPANGDETPIFSSYGYEYDTKRKLWKSLCVPTDNEGCEVYLGGGAAINMGNGLIMCVGGVNKSVFYNELVGKYNRREYLSHDPLWYDFNRRVMIYDTVENNWIQKDCEVKGRAGAMLLSTGSTYLIMEGEEKPGVRTNTFTKISNVVSCEQ